MKKNILIIVLGLMSTMPSFAENWVKINDSWQVDTDSIYNSKKYSKIWSRVDTTKHDFYTSKGEKVYEIQYLHKFNKNNTHKILRAILYDNTESELDIVYNPLGSKDLQLNTKTILPLINAYSSNNSLIETQKNNYNQQNTEISTQNNIDYPEWFYIKDNDKNKQKIKKNDIDKNLTCLKLTYNLEKNQTNIPVIEYYYIDTENSKVYNQYKIPVNKIINFDDKKIIFSVTFSNANNDKDYNLETVYFLDRYTGSLKVDQRVLPKSRSAKIEHWINKYGYNITDTMYAQGTGTATKENIINRKF